MAFDIQHERQKMLAHLIKMAQMPAFKAQSWATAKWCDEQKGFEGLSDDLKREMTK
jgi:hypothetical protein